MDGDGVQNIIEAARAAVLVPREIEGNGWSKLAVPAADGSWMVSDLPVTPLIPTLTVHTLEAFAEYVRANRDALPLSELVAHVRTESEVSLISKLQSEHTTPVRQCYVRAEWSSLFGLGAFIRFGQWTDAESFVIGLQAAFMSDDERSRVLEIVGNMRAEGVTTWNDDGISQGVVSGAGIKLGKVVGVPNPVTLRPYRTFREIAQPASQFVLRVRGSQGTVPQLALFEADGGAWRLEAIAAIGAWLKRQLPDDVTVIA